jgi:hypothetical protein
MHYRLTTGKCHLRGCGGRIATDTVTFQHRDQVFSAAGDVAVRRQAHCMRVRHLNVDAGAELLGQLLRQATEQERESRRPRPEVDRAVELVAQPGCSLVVAACSCYA